jgi:molecular chaperone GrpE
MVKQKKEQYKTTEEMQEDHLQSENLTAESITPEEIASLKQALEDMRSKSEEYLDGWQRSRAEFANYKRRIEREQAQLHQTISGAIIKQYLEVIDDLERALKNRPQEGQAAIWAEGIELIYRKFLAVLENEGATAMKAQGEQFDPNLHEAISSEENDNFKSGQIIEVIKQGYTLGDRVLRPALVRVAR